MPSPRTASIVEALARHGYNADRDAVTLLARAENPRDAVTRAVETASDETMVLTAEHVESVLEAPEGGISGRPPEPGEATDDNPTSSTATGAVESPDNDADTPLETGGLRQENGGNMGDPGEAPVGSDAPDESAGNTNAATSPAGNTNVATPPAGNTNTATSPASNTAADADPSEETLSVSGDIQSTGTGTYRDFVTVFQSRYEQLADLLSGRVKRRPASAVADLSDGSDTAMVGMVTDVYSTSGGHLRIVLEDTTGTYPCLVLEDRPFLDTARAILCDEVIAVEGSISKSGADDEGILFVDNLYHPDVPHTHSPSTADRAVRAALISDLHVGSQEFLADAWTRFTEWLHSDDAADVEYLLIAGDMVEGVGVYPGQDEELDVVDIYDQYETFSEHLKDVPGDMEIVMIPGNHDAVRLAEPQPAFDEELRGIMSAHDATISANPSTVTIEGVSILMYHGVSLDELIADVPGTSYDQPAQAMTHLLKKRHLAPQYGGKTRIAPEERDALVIDEVPDVFHAGHVHKFGHETYRGVLTVNSSCWQSQTSFQESVNLDPDVGYAPVVDLQTLELQYGQFV